MNCTCFKELEASPELLAGAGGRVESVTAPMAMVWRGTTIQAEPYIELRIKVEGKKKPTCKTLLFSYCPICGTSTKDKSKGKAKARKKAA